MRGRGVGKTTQTREGAVCFIWRIGSLDYEVEETTSDLHYWRTRHNGETWTFEDSGFSRAIWNRNGAVFVFEKEGVSRGSENLLVSK